MSCRAGSLALPFVGSEAAGATFDPTRTYRYTLWRSWGPETDGRVLWVMLNPSTADESVLDPTVRRCVGFAKAWGFGGIEVVNLFALRSTVPDVLYDHPDPVGPWNDEAILGAAARAALIVAAWGAHGGLRGRAAQVEQLLAGASYRLHCLGTTMRGHPRHPLYVRGDTAGEVYRG